MHIVLAVLGAIVTILVLLKRLGDSGIDIGWLNPFSWMRRRTWRKKYEGNPLFSLKEPIEVAAVLATTVAKIDGDISKEEKAILLALFQSEFGKTEKEASDLLMFSTFIFGDGQEAKSKPHKVMKRSLEKFSEDQADSVVSLLKAVKNIDARNAELKDGYVRQVEAAFSKQFGAGGTW